MRRIALGLTAAAVLIAAAPAGATAPGRNGLIAYTVDHAIHVVKPDGSGDHVLLRNASQPAWSPDGRRIAFVRSRDVWTADARGRHVRLVAKNANSPTWSPDGTRVAWRDWAGISLWWTRLSTGSNNRFVTGRGRFTGVMALDWAPRGNAIAFSTVLNEQHELHNQIWVGTIGEGRASKLIASSGPMPLDARDGLTAQSLSWSPSGAWLLSTDLRGGLWNVTQIGRAGGGPGDLAPTPLGFAAWSPDGKQMCGRNQVTGALDVGQAYVADTVTVAPRVAAPEVGTVCSWQSLPR